MGLAFIDRAFSKCIFIIFASEHIDLITSLINGILSQNVIIDLEEGSIQFFGMRNHRMTSPAQGGMEGQTFTDPYNDPLITDSRVLFICLYVRGHGISFEHPKARGAH